MIHLGNGYIGEIKTDTPLSYQGKDGQSILLERGEARINGVDMEINKIYTLKDNDLVEIFNGSIKKP